jgi:hypothetical protein
MGMQRKAKSFLRARQKELIQSDIKIYQAAIIVKTL